MKNTTKLFIAAAFLSVGMASAQSGVGVGTTTPDASAALDVTSTTKGFLMPRMTTAERTAIATPASGLQVYDTDLSIPFYYNGTAWVAGASSSSDATNDSWVDNTGNTVLNTGNVGIGTITPTEKLHVQDGIILIENSFPTLDFKDSDATINTGVLHGGIHFRDMNSDLLGFMGFSTVDLSMRFNNFNNGDIWFSTNANNTGKQLLLNTLGNVGIGNGSPTARLDVSGNIRSSFGSGNRGQINFGTLLNNWEVGSDFSGNGNTPDLGDNFYIFQRSTGALRFNINNTGNVGIGTTTPTSKLQVVGLPVHADNAAAATAGLTAGAFYHNGDGVVRVVF